MPLIVSFFFYKTNNEFKVRDELKELFNTVFGTFLNTRWNVYVKFKDLPISYWQKVTNLVILFTAMVVMGARSSFFGQFSVSVY